jgi:hypothetical protein
MLNFHEASQQISDRTHQEANVLEERHKWLVPIDENFDQLNESFSNELLIDEAISGWYIF